MAIHDAPQTIGVMYPSSAVRVSVLTIFPNFFSGPLDVSIVKRAQDVGALEVELVDIRNFTSDVHRTVDDAPFGGGAGMVMKPEPLSAALEGRELAHRVFLTPSGTPLTQSHLDEWAKLDELVLLCGRYEGVDQRVVDASIDEEVSIGDYVLAGGEVAALTVIEGVARLLDGVLGNPDSVVHESFRGGLLEEPQFTRPASFEGMDVPAVLLSGNHAKVEEWRQQQRLKRTAERRPDLLEQSDPDA
jgi:tRNA (guanine37-N1)-methyltransferase